MRLHKFCELFPVITGKEMSDLVEDIRANGLREKIITLNGEILDGQNRLNACEVAKVKPQFEKFKGKEQDALAFVISKNMTRRHLDVGERAMIALEIAEASKGETSITAAAEKMQVSRGAVHEAKKIKKASKSLAKKVKSGKITLHAAEKKIAPEPRPERPALDFADVYTASPVKKDIRTTGQICHDAFIGEIGSGDQWDELIPNEQKAWQVAADAIKGKF